MLKKIKIAKGKFKSIVIICIFLIISILAIYFLQFSKKNDESYIKNNYTYNIEYQANTNTYNIYKIDNTVKVFVEEQIQCIKDPCPPLKENFEIKFSKKNMKIVDDFITSLFSNSKHNHVKISVDYLNDEQYSILKSIIYNDENILNPNSTTAN